MNFRLADIVCVPFAYVLRFFNDICGGNYIFTLLLFAILVKLLMVPMSIKQQKNQIKGAMLRPKMAIIEKKYAGKTDQNSIMQKRQELMDMQQREGYSPLAGCLPLLIQFPVIIALYEVIRNPLTYIARLGNDVVAKLYNLSSVVTSDPARALNVTSDMKFKALKSVDQIKLVSEISADSAKFAEVGADLSKLPSFKIFGKVDLAGTPTFNFSSPNAWLLFIPVVSFVLAFITMKLSKKYNGNLQQELAGQSADQRTSTAMMDWMMPLMSLVFGFILNGALGIYWVYQSAISIGQMALFNKIWPMPTFTPEEIRAYEKSLKQRPKANGADPNRPKPRSLHHIDDDD